MTMQQIFTYVTYGVLLLLIIGIAIMIIGVNSGRNKVDKNAVKQAKLEAKAAAKIPQGSFAGTDEDDLVASAPVRKRPANGLSAVGEPVNGFAASAPAKVQQPINAPATRKPGSFFDDMDDEEFTL